MHSTIRRYHGVDQNRMLELTSKVDEILVPRLSKLPGFAGYYLIEAGSTGFSSLGLFETVRDALTARSQQSDGQALYMRLRASRPAHILQGPVGR